MNYINDLIPKDKFDTSGISLLTTIDVDEAEPILGVLLEWIQDINWPVAKELLNVLPRFHSGLIPHIKAVLNSDDDIWKCWVLVMLKNFPPETVSILSTEIKRIADSPTQTEILEGANEYAKELLYGECI